MKRLLLLLGLCAPVLAAAQPLPRPTAGPAVRYERRTAQPQREPLFDERLRPFYHGVASGDPLPDGVVLWTRITPEAEGPVETAWRVALDPTLRQVVRSGTARTDAARDYTVKVDVRGLQPGTTYYYGFTALGSASLTGRTRTAPLGAADHLRFAVASCANYPQGFFNAYARIAERADLDAVFHLGDYLYEYAGGDYGGERPVEPDREILTLDDYRIRHSLYKLDPELRRAHQQHPFIAVWDDHETANDSWKEGAQNHQPETEGPWSERRAGAVRAYYEWMPVRDLPGGNGPIYRRLSYGDLADVFMIDTRLEARQQPLALKGGPGGEIDTTAWFDPGRTLLGADQLAWLTAGLAASTARWKVIGNQVMMVQLAPHPELSPQLTFTNLDAWDGYPAERERLLGFIREQDVRNTVVLTGDIHSSWAADLPPRPFDGYDPATGAGSAAVELVTPSITSSTFADGLAAAGIPLAFASSLLRSAYPHVRGFDLAQHGYFVLDLKPARAQADWFHVDIAVETNDQRNGMSFIAAADEPRLVRAAVPAPPKPDPPALAPADPPAVGTGVEPPEGPAAGLLVVGSYPNPVRSVTTLHYVLSRPQPLRVRVYDLLGREVATLLDETQPAGIYALPFDASALPNGTYLYRIEAPGAVRARSFVVSR